MPRAWAVPMAGDVLGAGRVELRAVSESLSAERVAQLCGSRRRDMRCPGVSGDAEEAKPLRKASVGEETTVSKSIGARKKILATW